MPSCVQIPATPRQGCWELQRFLPVWACWQGAGRLDDPPYHWLSTAGHRSAGKPMAPCRATSPVGSFVMYCCDRAVRVRDYISHGAYHQVRPHTITTVSRRCFSSTASISASSIRPRSFTWWSIRPRNSMLPSCRSRPSLSFVQPREDGTRPAIAQTGFAMNFSAVRSGPVQMITQLNRHRQCAAHRVRQSAQVANGHLADKFVYWQWDDRSEQCLESL